MELSFLLAKEIAKLFLIMFMGYAIVKSGLIKSKDSKSISVVLVYLVIPCVILNAFQVDYTPDIQKNLIFAFAAAIGLHILFLFVNVILRKILHLNVIEQANIIYPNAGILIFPLVQALQGQDYILYSSAFMTVQLVFLWTHCKGMLCKSSKTDWKKILLNVNILSILVGLVLFLFHIRLPYDLQDTLNSMSNMAGPLGMLLAGMVIAEVPLKSVFLAKRNYLPTALRLLIYPMLSLILLKCFQTMQLIPDSKGILLTVYLAAITPACATVTSMAQLYDKEAAYSSVLYVLTTLLSIVTMPIMVGLFQVFI